MDLDRNYCYGRVWALGKDCDLRLLRPLCEEGVKIIISRTHWLFYCHISEACQGHTSSEVDCLEDYEIIPGQNLLNW